MNATKKKSIEEKDERRGVGDEKLGECKEQKKVNGNWNEEKAKRRENEKK